MGTKRFRDPIYGYIEIEKNLIMQVVDTPAFQRLRDVVQTSYSPLYSSAVHNRFVHSLGVLLFGLYGGKSVYRFIKSESKAEFAGQCKGV